MLSGPVQYQWMYPFERFIGDSERFVKNKARVENSICVSYLHRETTHFCSHYFNLMMLTPTNKRNEIHPESGKHQANLSVFNFHGRHFGKENEYWLTNQELRSAHIHVLINSNEVKSYLT